MKIASRIILAVLCISSLFAENQISRHGLTLHAGGSLAMFEYEYQYKFMVKDKHTLSATVGINSFAINLGFPVGINYTYGQQNQLLLGVRFMPCCCPG